MAAKKTAPEKGEEGSEEGEDSGEEYDDDEADQSFEPIRQGESFEEPEQMLGEEVRDRRGANEPQEQIQPKKEKRTKKAEEKKGQSGEVGDITAEIIAQIGGHNSKQNRSKKGKKVKQPAKELCIFDPHVGLDALEFIRQELHKRGEAKLEPITTVAISAQ